MTHFRQDYKNIAGNFTIGGKTYYFRAMFERRWAGILEICKQYESVSRVVLGFVLRDWFYEPRTFPFDGPDIKAGLKGKRRGVLDYRPDFQLIRNDDLTIWHEGKGYMDKKSATKLRCMKTYYPDEIVYVVVDRLPRGRTAKSRNKRARFDFLKQLGYPIIEARPFFNSFAGWLRQIGVDL